ncbi:MAG: c-type cytochrome [Gemmatimonadota bacterium]
MEIPAMDAVGRLIRILALIVGSLVIARPAWALDVLAAQRLARQSGCLECHSIYQKKVGPAWKDVATKYHGAPDAEKKLYLHVTTGRKAKFDDGHEEDHPIVKTSDPKRIKNLVDWILALPIAAPVDIPAAETLARQSACMKCHDVNKKKIGPAWKDVAAKYLGQLGAEDKLYKHVTTGRMAKFPDGHEEHHPIVKTSDPDRINNLVNWILSLK